MLNRRLRVIAPSTLVLLLAACTATAPRPEAVSTAARAAAHQTGSPATGSPAPADRPAGTVTLAFAGDVNFARRTAPLLRDPATAFGPISSVLKAADFTALNLETAVTSRGAPQPKTYHFRTRPAAFTALRDGGVEAGCRRGQHHRRRARPQWTAAPGPGRPRPTTRACAAVPSWPRTRPDRRLIAVTRAVPVRRVRACSTRRTTSTSANWPGSWRPGGACRPPGCATSRRASAITTGS